MIKIILFVFVLLHSAQSDQKQTIGNTVTYELYCPCKLFKYYEDGQISYYCNDKSNKLEYIITEYKHQDGIDLFINSIKQNISATKKTEFLTTIETSKKKALENYLKNNPNGQYVSLLGEQAVITISDNESKLFFSDKNFIVSYELRVVGSNENILQSYFESTLKSLRTKTLNF